ncbi:MAG: hypothetical protein ACLTXE_26165 [Enterocloster aldenensis]
MKRFVLAAFLKALVITVGFDLCYLWVHIQPALWDFLCGRGNLFFSAVLGRIN